MATDRQDEAFEDLVHGISNPLLRTAVLLSGDWQQAEDLVQTALSKTYSRYGSFDNDHHFEAYVRTTMYRTFISWWRRLQWRSEVPSDSPPDRPSNAGEPWLGTDVHRALATLPRLQRTCLVLRYFEDRPTREVAQLLGIPEGTVTSHVSRGLAALRISPHLAQEDRP